MNYFSDAVQAEPPPKNNSPYSDLTDCQHSTNRYPKQHPELLDKFAKHSFV
ncbi:MAG: hypothetical protein WAN66_03195 [Limnoraphis robusta]|uniref:hypothetical protein n=1 Tax=Limnoraphis robusta TaxID=1118279 RepID=UPI0013649F8B|nr:hypothetical protein [Limnoraphis robusta]MCG5060407.1 hypothetical protein [Limnoraphis sp. WC205]